TCTCLTSAPAWSQTPATAPVAQKAIEPVAQLEPGKEPGTFHLVYEGRAELSMPGHCALKVTLAEFPNPIGVVAAKLTDAGPFKAEADVRPGTHVIPVAPEVEKDADYWPNTGERLHVDKAGRLYLPRTLFAKNAGVHVLERRIKGVSPATFDKADARQ